MIKISKMCTACGACVQCCPKGCIRFEQDQTGFAMPVVDTQQCVNCGLCNKICHLDRKAEDVAQEQRAYAVVSRDVDVLQRSTSGGAFTAIAEHVIGQDGVVYGCAYTEDLEARHIRIESMSELKKLNGSKYVRSEIGNCYAQAKKDLDAGTEVFFTGTPCQIAGLKTFLQKDYSNLLTADLICHGVPDPVFFDKYIRWYEKKHNINVQDYNFRSKENAGWSLAGICTGISAKTGKQIKKKIYYFNEYYFNYFLSGEIYREGCYECKYANLQRPGDFTLGDFWGIETQTLPFVVKNGCSLLLVNTPKGKDLFEKLSLEGCEMPIETAVSNNTQLSCASVRPASRDAVLQQMLKWDAEKINKDFLSRKRLTRLKGWLKYLLPPEMKSKLIGWRAKISKHK